MENASSENAFSDNWPKTHFLRDQKWRFPIGIFLITFSDSLDLLKTGSFLMNLGLSKTVTEKSFETQKPTTSNTLQESSCTDSTHIGSAVATTATAAAGARGQSACYVIVLPRR